ncbi:hypothetical protein HYC85_013863 [Camellia sinensis]|uniref:Uncharacterized protein n=1 Tax=Camellia sinensis TaxID=4442 RepID=A0A7J7H7Y5_CAMSI|nr:hypothetical protein HYC85_013863 [Camellia sinensis]
MYHTCAPIQKLVVKFPRDVDQHISCMIEVVLALKELRELKDNGGNRTGRLRWVPFFFGSTEIVLLCLA